VICWSCEREAGAGPFCGACQALLPPAEGADHFAVLGLPRRYGIDLSAAEGAYQKLSRRLHPDRFATADPRARRASLAHTVQLNQAWRTLKDPVRRAEYLLELAGVDVAGDDQKPSAGAQRETRKVAVPPAFLMEILELHDDFGEARRGGDAAKVAALTEEMRGRAAQAMKTIAAALDTGSTAAPEAARLDEAARALIALRYYRRFLDEAEAHQEGAALSAGLQMSEAGPRGG
jgi:molecular chaperone HscB